MFDKKCNDRMNAIIQSEESARDRAFELFALMNETRRTFFHNRWAEKVLHKTIKQFLKDNGLSFGSLLEIALADPEKYKRSL